MRRHQGVEGGNDGLGEAKSGGKYCENSRQFREGSELKTSWNTPVVLSQGLEQVLAQLVHLQSLAHSADAIKLDVAENFRI